MGTKAVQVLLVEDNPGDARLLQELLSAEDPAGFELTHVERLNQALEGLGQASFDLVLLDLLLPDSQGLHTFTRIWSKSPRLPIIILTGLDDETLASEAVRRGAQDYLVKGRLDRETLVRAMRFAMARKTAEEAARQERDAVALRIARQTREGSRARIMVVEDENILSLEIKNRLLDLGYRVSAVVSSGARAVERAVQTQPDLVLMDIRLKGGMDGIEAAEHIRSRLDIPVIYLTAYADDMTLQRAKVTEPFGYLLKPFEERDLHTAIEMALYKHEMEWRLRQSEQWLSTTLRSIGDAVIATDLDGAITFMNPIAVALTHWSYRRAMGQAVNNVLHLVSEDTRLRYDPIQEVLDKGLSTSPEQDVVLAVDGRAEIPVDYNAAPLRSAQGQLTGAVLIFRDVSERKRMEQELLRSERLAAMGHLSAALAHEMNNPLQSIVSSVGLLLDFELEEEERQECLAAVRQEIERLMTLTGHVLDFAHPRPLRQQHVALDEVVRYVLILAGKQLEHCHIRVHLDLPDGTPGVLASRDQLAQVLLNLLLNATDAMPSGGRLQISTRPSGERVELVIADSGPGIPPDVLDRIFEPFFTTKKGGTGLGLSISYSIIEQYGGTISAANGPGGGAVFMITLPAVPDRGR